MDEGALATFGTVLKRYRLRAGWTQEALAERARISARAVSDLERGLSRAPQRDTLGRLVGDLGLDADERRAVESVAQPGPHRPRPGAPPRAVGGRGHNLPAPLTSFVGRDREITEIATLLSGEPDRPRLLTVTGAGGSGKTRLVLEVAERLSPGYADGVWLAELAATADPVLVPAAVAGVLGVREEPGRPLTDTLAEALRPRRLLLVLDNCEHLVEACATLARELLRACPSVRILAASRPALGISGEMVWPVPPLSLPAPADGGSALTLEEVASCDAVRLFVERGRFSRPGFALTVENAPAVLDVCRRLDGLPLALELAAARLRVLSPVQIAGRLNDRFRLLTGGDRAAPERQQTLHAAIDWSYTLLPPQEQALFDRLSVFAGGWTLEAAEGVCGETEGEARASLEEALSIRRELGDRHGIAWSLVYLAEVARSGGDGAGAPELYQRGQAEFRQLGYRDGVAQALRMVGRAAHEGGDLATSGRALQEALTIYVQLANWVCVTRTLEDLAGLASAEGRPERALCLSGAAAALREALSRPPTPTEAARLAHHLGPVYRVVSDEARVAAAAGGRSLTMEQVVAVALEEAPAQRPGVPAPEGPATDRVREVEHMPSPAQCDGLTAREVEVLRLIASGRSNQQIAHALVLSVRPVERHVANTYAKIGAHGRAEATAIAFRERLV